MMTKEVDNLVIGQGLAGSAVAWTLHQAGQTVHVIDKVDPATASRVSGGLITPMTGKRLVKSPDFVEYWAAATEYYRSIEAATSCHFFEVRPMLRLFKNDEARQQFKERSEAEAVELVDDWNGQLQTFGQQQSGIEMSPAGRLEVTKYLQATRAYFQSLDAFSEGDVDLRRLNQDQEGRYFLEFDSRAVRAVRIIHCTGVIPNAVFPEVPDNPSRGDILSVSIPNYIREEVVHRSIWIAPEGNERQLVGSTYDWKNTSSEPTEAGRQQLLSQLSRMVEGPVEVHQQTAGVRPTMKDYEPVVGRHPLHPNQYVLNGLGSKGVLRSPLLASKLLQLIEGTSSIPAKQDYARLIANHRERQRPLTVLAQEAIAEVIQPGDIALDGTVGNGFDTCFLAKSVGDAGKVIGFDLQASAIESTRKRLLAQRLTNVTLVNIGHENLNEAFQKGTVSAVMFNLGYLPRSDKSVVTQANTSEKAINSAMEVLKPGGRMTVLAYRGHEGGAEEYEAVQRLLESKSTTNDLKRIDSDPPRSNTPVLFVLTISNRSKQ